MAVKGLRWFWLSAALLAFAVGAGAGPLREARPLMGTLVEVALDPGAGGEAAAHRAIDAAYREMQRLSDMMNHYDPASVVSAINAAAGLRAVPCPPELIAVLSMAQAMSARSDGAFDVTVASIRGWRFRADDPRMPSPAAIAAQLPLVGWHKLRLDARAYTAFLTERGMRVDLGGIAKLAIVHAGIAVLRRHGIARAMVNGGGDVEVVGGDGARPWRIGVRDPRAPEALLGVLVLARGFVATSGDYERAFVRDGRRYHHILDPRTGTPARGPRGVTLTGERLEDVNGLGVAIMVRGKAAGERWLAEDKRVDGLIVDADGSVWMTPGFRARFSAPR
ncbi:MAG: FAD:protein FMN transferase [Burkholderiales bacterium]